MQSCRIAESCYVTFRSIHGFSHLKYTTVARLVLLTRFANLHVSIIVTILDMFARVPYWINGRGIRKWLNHLLLQLLRQKEPSSSSETENLNKRINKE